MRARRPATAIHEADVEVHCFARVNRKQARAEDTETIGTLNRMRPGRARDDSDYQQRQPDGGGPGHLLPFLSD